MKKILLLGDSIRMSYQTYVKDKLDGVAEVMGPDENCRFAKYTLWNLQTWITDVNRPDIIHWNNGIWDIFRINNDIGIFSSLEEYTKDIQRILKELRKWESKIIWATTTPVNDKNVNCRNSDIDKYNDAVLKFMQKEQIEINDLNTVVRANIDSFISEDNLHLTYKGRLICSDAVTNAIIKHL